MRNNLKVIRKEKKLSQQELADRTGLSRHTIMAIESEREAPIKSDTIVALVKALKVPAEKIFPDFR